MNVMWRAGASLATICAMAVFVNCAAAQDPMRPNPSRYKPGDIVILNRDIDDNGMSGLEFAERAGAPLVGQVCHMVIKKGTALRVADTDDFHAGAIFNLTHDGQPTRDVRMFPDSDLDPALTYSTDNIIDPIPLTGCRSFADIANGEKEKTANLEATAVAGALAVALAGVALWATAGGGISRYRTKQAQRLAEQTRARAAAVQDREEEARYEEFWPAARFPRRSPKSATEKEQWEAILVRWPAPPKTERERVENEKKFWNTAVVVFTVDTGHGPELSPKQTIIDDFLALNDVWLREYYAATGIYHEPYDGPEMQRQIGRLSNAHRAAKLAVAYTKKHRPPPSGSREPDFMKEATIDVKNAMKELDEYQAKSKKEFAEERGGWFFGQIQRAYNERYAPARDFGPHSAETPANHAAQDDLEYKPNA